ncbi:MAG: ABC transporter ATP-binding protein [Cytophagales bacterium]|nr:ABC transporter ATP-binding protein [Armatimonadota bacterium]
MAVSVVKNQEAAPGRTDGKRVGRRLLSYLAKHKGRFIPGLLCGVLVGVFQARVALVVKSFIDGLSGRDHAPLLIACVSVVALYAILGLLKYTQSILLSVVAQRIGLEMRRDVYAHLQTLSLSYFHQRRTGALMSTLTSDIPKLQNAAMMLKDVIATPAQGLITLGTMLFLSWKLTLFTLFVLPLTAAFIQTLTRRLRSISKETQNRFADVAGLMEETLAAPRIVRAFTAEAHEIARFEAQSEKVIESQLTAARRSARLGPVVDLIGATGIAFVLYVGGSEVLEWRMSSGELIAYLLLVSTLAGSVNSIGNLKSSWEEMMGAADRIFSDVLDVVPEIRDAPDATPLPPVQGHVEFRDVSFAYERGTPALTNVSLTLEPGSVVALVGSTGAGKSTLADMIPRFYDPTSGAVLIDGQDIRAVTIESLRSQIGIVPQETLLFSGTLRDNIAYGKRDATDEEIMAAARAANADSFIQSFPQKYQTVIGERGAMLSGGEKQRIAIARALLANPRILILDEATSALDAATEALVQEALDTLMKGRTTLIIAHRLSTIVNANTIVVLRKGGAIAEQGTHADLMAQRGIYAALYETQQRTAALSATTAEP